MTSEITGDVLARLWDRMASQRHLYVVYFNDAVPYIEDPELIPQEEYCPEGKKEALILAFLSKEDALSYAHYLPEIHEDLRQSSLTVRRITKRELFARMEELQAMSEQEHGHPTRIDIAQCVEGEDLLSDTIFSPFLSLS